MKFTFELGKLRFQLGTRNSEPGVRKSANSPIQAWLRGEEGTFGSASPLLASPFQQSVWVYTAVCALAQTISAIPFRISQGDRSRGNLITSGPAVDLFNRPHTLPYTFLFYELI